MMRTLLAGILFAASLACLAQYPAAAPPEAATTNAVSPPARIADVAWLQGYWTGEGLGGQVEDVWLPPKAGVLLGAFRLMKADGKPGFYELYAIEEVDDTLQFVVKHFNPDWVGWEEKDKALRIRLSRIAKDEIAFGRIVFWRTGPDSLVVDLGLRQKDGSVKSQSLSYTRKPL